MIGNSNFYSPLLAPAKRDYPLLQSKMQSKKEKGDTTLNYVNGCVNAYINQLEGLLAAFPENQDIRETLNNYRKL